jgi:hypothetical protein
MLDWILPSYLQIEVKPIYGWGWLREGGTPMEVPAPFPLDATILTPGAPFKSAFGVVAAERHELNGLWIWLWQRTSGDDPTFNVSAFRDRPIRLEAIHKAHACITGFATASLLR